MPCTSDQRHTCFLMCLIGQTLLAPLSGDSSAFDFTFITSVWKPHETGQVVLIRHNTVGTNTPS